MKRYWIGVCLGAAMWGQNAPQVDRAGLMSVRFYEANGGIMIEHLVASGVEPGASGVTVEVSGPVSKSIPMRVDRLSDQIPGYARLAPNGPGIAMLGKPGNYQVRVKAGGAVLAEQAFELKQEGQYYREGQWRTLAFFDQRVDNAEAPIAFHFWGNLRELAGKSRAMVTVHLMRGGQEVATTRSPVVLTWKNWQPFQVDLEQPKALGGKFLTAQALAKKDGDFTVVLEADGQQWKSYRGRVRGGKIETLPGMAAQRVDTSSGSTSAYHLMDTYWLER